MSIRLYHGSKYIVRKPKYGEGNRRNDYGQGFYCTESIELAKEWACASDEDGFANCYDFDIEGLNVLDLNSEDYNILNWLALLTKYRGYWQKGSIAEDAKKYLQEHFLVDISEYDVIKGYRADDSYFTFAQDFIMGAISLEKLSSAMRLGKLGQQIVLKSKKAFDSIRFVCNKDAFASEYFIKKITRDKEARRTYRTERNSNSKVDEIYMIDIMRRGLTNDDIRI